MIDLHVHLLPGLDDGPSSMEESIEMAALAYRDGTRIIAATPHNRDVVGRSSISHAKALVERLRRELAARAIDVRILFGMENHLEMDTPQQVDNGLALPIEGSRLILVELPFELYPFHTEETLRKLIDRGLRPMIAHPERSEPIQRSPALMAGLVDMGVLGQLTAGSLDGSYGDAAREASNELLRRGLAHVIASDGHGARTRRGGRPPAVWRWTRPAPLWRTPPAEAQATQRYRASRRHSVGTGSMSLRMRYTSQATPRPMSAPPIMSSG